MYFTIQNWHVRCLGCALTLAIAGTITGRTFAQRPETKAQIEAVFKDWKDRQSIFKSARYVLVGTTEFKGEKRPPGNPIQPCRTVLLLDFVKKRYHMERSEEIPYANGKAGDPSQWEYRKRISTSAYDGEALQSLTHRKANRLENDRQDDLSIGKGNLGMGAQFGSEVCPIFFAHGIVPTVHSPLFVDRLPLTHDPDDFDIAGSQLLRGDNCLVVRTEPLPGNPPISDEFWINLQQKSAIPRLVYFSGSNPWDRLDIVWKNTAHGWWVDHWSLTWSPNGKVRRITRYRVESFEGNPAVSDSNFRIPAEPGMIVKVSEGPSPGKGLNPFKAASTTYKISPSGSWDEISAEGFTTLEGKKLPPEWRWKWIACTICGVLAIAASLYYIVRRKRRMAAL